MIAGSLELQMYANLARLTQDMEQAKRTVTGAMDSVSSAVRQAQAVLAGLGLAAAAVKFAEMTRGAMEAQAGLKQLSEQTNSTVESLSALKGVAKLSETDMGTVAAAINKLSKAMVEGSPAFQAIGVNAKELSAGMKDPAAMMLTVASHLDQFRDSAGKTAVEMALLGKTGAELGPFLKDLAEKGDLVGRVTAEQAKAADELEKNMVRWKAAGRALYNDMAALLAPKLNDILTGMLEVRKESGLLAAAFYGIGGAIVAAFGGETDPLKKLQNQALELSKTLMEQQALAAGRAKNGSGIGFIDSWLWGDQGDIDKTKAQLKAVNQQIAAMAAERAKAAQASEAAKDKPVIDFGPPPDTKAYDAAIKKAEDFMAALRKEAAEQGATLEQRKIYEAETVAASLKAQGVKEREIVAYLNAAAAVAHEMQAKRDLIETAKEQNRVAEEFIAADEAQQKAIVDGIRGLRERITAIEDDTATLTLNEQELAAHRVALEMEKSGLDATSDAYVTLKARLEAAYADNLAAKTAKQAADANKQAADSIRGSLTDALMRGFEGGAGFAQNFFDTLKNMAKTLILRPVIQFAVTPLASAAAGAIGGLGLTGGAESGGWGSLLSTGSSVYSGLTSGNGVLGTIGNWFGLGGGAATADIGAGMGAMTSAELVGAAGSPYALAGGISGGVGSGLGLGIEAGTGTALIAPEIAGAATAAGSATGAAAVGAATEAAGTGALAAIGTALPWIGAAIAIYSMFSSSGGGPKSGGSYLLNQGIEDHARIYTPNQDDATMKTIVQGVQGTYQSVAQKLGIGLQQMTFGLGYDTDPQGTAPNRVTSIVNGMQATHEYGRDDAALKAGIQAQAAEMIRGALQSSFDAVDAQMGQLLHDHLSTTVDDMGAFASGLVDVHKEILNTADATSKFGQALDWQQLQDAANAGENVVQTYQRVSAEATAFNSGMQALGLHLDVTGADAMKLKDAMVQASGGIQQFSAMVQNLVNLKDGLYQFDLKMSQTIFNLTGKGDPAAQIFQHGVDLYNQFQAASDPAQRLALIQQGTDLVGQWLQQTQAQIQRQLQDQVNAINARISGLNAEKSAIQAAAQERQSALQAELAIAQQWTGVLDTAKQAISQMQLSAANPMPVFGRLGMSQASVADLEARYGSASGADKAALGSQLLQALNGQLQLAQEALQRPSQEYQTQYNAIIREMTQVQADAQEQANKGIELQTELNALTEATNAQLSAIDAQIAAAQSEITAAQAAAQAAQDAANQQAAGYYQWLKDQGDAIYQDQIKQATDQLTLLAEQVGLLQHIDATISGTAGQTAALPGHASGLDYVPRDNYVARLHRGERVLTAAENRAYSEGGRNGGTDRSPIVVNVNIPAGAPNSDEIKRLAREGVMEAAAELVRVLDRARA